jgi:lipoprotein-anchoring transpeptidase ErfK/SrfK
VGAIPARFAVAALAATAVLSPSGAVAAGQYDPPKPKAVAPKPLATAPTATKAWTARVVLPVVMRAAPTSRAKRRGRLGVEAPYDRGPQVLLVLQARTSVRDGVWYRVLLPSRPNGASAWVPARAVQVKPTPFRVRVQLGARRAAVLRAGRVVASWAVGVGTSANPTPTGRFAISEVVPQDNAAGFYGPFIMTLTAHSEALSDFDGGDGRVALHGTSRPDLLGQAVSHGCVRLPNAAARRIARLVPPGAPVDIIP